MTNTVAKDVSEIINRDLAALAQRISQLPEDHLWKPLPGIINPMGTLALHLCGNLRHFIGQVLGEDGYIRDREAEFAQMRVSMEFILREIQTTQQAVQQALAHLTEDRLNEPMPDTPPQHKGKTIGFFLIQLCCHLSWHRGQADYLVRILQATTRE
jgi:uncharacterized damage-inducible protein DinB